MVWNWRLLRQFNDDYGGLRDQTVSTKIPSMSIGGPKLFYLQFVQEKLRGEVSH